MKTKTLTALLYTLFILSISACQKEQETPNDCDGQIGLITSLVDCGVIIVLEDGTRFRDTSLRLWDIEVDNKTRYCIRFSEQTSATRDGCVVDFETEVFSIKQLE